MKASRITSLALALSLSSLVPTQTQAIANPITITKEKYNSLSLERKKLLARVVLAGSAMGIAHIFFYLGYQTGVSNKPTMPQTRFTLYI